MEPALGWCWQQQDVGSHMQVVSYFLVSRLIIVHLFLSVLRASHCFICCVRLGCSEFSCRIPFGRMEREREDCHLLRRFLCCGGCCGLHSRCACLTVVAFPRGSPVKKTVSFKISKQIYHITSTNLGIASIIMNAC